MVQRYTQPVEGKFWGSSWADIHCTKSIVFQTKEKYLKRWWIHQLEDIITNTIFIWLPVYGS